MKNTIALLAAALVVSTALPALAADLIAYDPVPVIDAAPVIEQPVVAAVTVPAAHDWTGAYAGVVVGRGWGTTEHTVPGTGEFDAIGWLAGANVGYNYQLDGNIVTGFEGDLAWSDINGSAGAASTDLDWVSTLRGRVGYAFDSFLPYVSGGFALADVNGKGVGYDASEVQLGLAGGAGVEVAVTEDISLKAEYLYLNFGGDFVVHGDVPQDIELDSHAIRAGLNFSF